MRRIAANSMGPSQGKPLVRRGRGGLALIIVAGVLGLLAVLATTFVTMAQLERRASAQRLHATKAGLLARSGIEDALARLDLGQAPGYGGEDWDGDGNLSTYEAVQEVYRPTGAGTPADTWSCPVRHALRASFSVSDPLDSLKRPARVVVDGRDRGYSGFLAPDFVASGNTYTLKVQSGGIFLNGGDPAQAATSGYNAVLRRILGTLAEAVDREDGVNDGAPVDQMDGERLVDLRPQAGWKDWGTVRDVAFLGNQTKLDVLKPYVVLHAWMDRKVVAPNASLGMAGPYSSWGEMKLAYGEKSPGSRAPDFERLGGRVVGRSPVDFPWARNHRPVLLALCSGLAGLYLDETTASAWQSGDSVGTLGAVQIANTWSASDDAHRVAEAIRSSTSEIRTWADWNAFCDTIPLAGGTDVARIKRDILKANFNPNTDLNKFNPNLSMWKTVDKGDLLAYSTEFSLEPSQGFECVCVGRILGLDGRVAATRSVRAQVGSAGLLRLTTQGEFICSGLGDPDLAGDETGFRVPGEAAFLTESQEGDPGTRTWGHRLSTTGWMAGDSNGVSLQCYPEPFPCQPAAYDGNLQLATIETPDDDLYSVNAAPNDMRFLLRFDDSFVADRADGSSDFQPDSLMVSTTELGLSLWDASRPNTLLPDGVYAELGRTPAYPDLGNSHGYHGVISFWVKPNYRPPGPRGRFLLTRTSFQNSSWGYDQFFALADCTNAGFGSRGVHFFLEVGQEMDDASMEWCWKAESNLAERSWNLLTFFWDFRSVTPVGSSANDVGRIVLGSQLGDQTNYNLGPWSDNAPLSARDITQDDLGGPGGSFAPHLMALGPLVWRDLGGDDLDYLGKGADATFDELAVYDFGGVEPTGSTDIPFSPAPKASRNSAEKLAGQRYREGRYYKGSVYAPAWASGVQGEAGSFLTAPITLPAGSRLRRVSWTWVRPQALPTDYAEIELVDTGATDFLWPGNAPASRSTRGPGWSRTRQDWTTNRVVPGPFRARVVFRRPGALDQDTPLLDSPILDDLTFLYDPPRGRQVLIWTEASGGD